MKKYPPSSRSSFRSVRRPFLLALILVFLALPMAEASEQTGLFEATYPVMTQDASERKIAFEMGLIDVLIKNSGILQIASRPNISELLAESEALVARYVYRNAAEDSNALAPLYLNMHFDPTAIRERLAQLDLPYWPEQRLPVAVWVVIDQPSGRRLIGRNDPLTTPWREMLQHHAARRGVELLFPILDEKDWESVQISDVWGGFTASIQTATQRYETHQFLTGVVHHAPEGAFANRTNRWSFRSDFDQQAWSDSHEEARVSIEAAIDLVMVRLAEFYALRPSQEVQNRLSLLFSGIRQPKHYAQLQSFIQAQPSVSRLALVAQEGDRSLFEVTLVGQKEVFYSALRNATFLRELSEQGRGRDVVQSGEGSRVRDEQTPSFFSSLLQGRELRRYHYEEGR